MQHHRCRSIEDEYKDTEQREEIYNKICSKVVIVNDLDQDAIISDYFLTSRPNLPVLLTYTQYTAMGYLEGREAKIGSDIEYYYSAEWMQEKLADKGVLADVYLANIVEAEDSDEETPITHYQRVIVTVEDDAPTAATAQQRISDCGSQYSR